MGTIYYIDADIENADWPKRTWDQPTEVDYWLDLPTAELVRRVGLPSWRARPAEVFEVVADRLLLDPTFTGTVE